MTDVLICVHTRERADEIHLTFILHPGLIRNKEKNEEEKTGKICYLQLYLCRPSTWDMSCFSFDHFSFHRALSSALLLVPVICISLLPLCVCVLIHIDKYSRTNAVIYTSIPNIEQRPFPAAQVPNGRMLSNTCAEEKLRMK